MGVGNEIVVRGTREGVGVGTESLWNWGPWRGLLRHWWGVWGQRWGREQEAAGALPSIGGNTLQTPSREALQHQSLRPDLGSLSADLDLALPIMTGGDLDPKGRQPFL